MPIAELFLGALLPVLFERLASRELLNFARREGIDKPLKKWEKMLISINQVLDDAEDRQLTGHLGVKLWLEDLTNLAYDIEDLPDEFATESAENKSKAEPSTSKVRLQELFNEEGCEAKLRLNEDGKPYVTDNSNYIVDLYFKTPIKDGPAAGKEISSLEGVVEHGFLLDMATAANIAGNTSLDVKTN